MNAGRDVERLIADWFVEEAVLRAPDRVLEATGRVVDRTKQRRFGVAWRSRLMSTPLRLAAAAVVGVLMVGGAIVVLRPDVEGVGGPSPTPAPTLPSAEPTAAGACDLVTADEAERLAGTVGLGALPTQSGSGEVTTCIYRDGGSNIVLRLEYTASGGLAAFDAVRAVAGVQTIDALGEAAVYDPATSTLYVRKGDGLVAIFATAFAQSPDRRLELATAVAEVAVDRMQP
jgi:hypothetical protein